jgi:hypothetical protein
MAEVEYKGFKIATRQQAGKWIARISKTNDAPTLIVSLPNSTGRRPWLDTQPPTFSEEAAIWLAKDAIDGGSVQ